MCYECFIRALEEVVVGYCVDINSSMFGRNLESTLKSPVNGDGMYLSQVRETVDERSHVRSRKVLPSSLHI